MPFQFAYVCDLYERLELIEQHPLAKDAQLDRRRSATREWFEQHRLAIDPTQIDLCALLSCLLPEKRVDRKFHVGFNRLSKALGCAQGLPAEYVQRLQKACNGADFASEACRILKERSGSAISNLSIDDIDGTLAQLASIGRASSVEVKQSIDWDKALNQNDILKATFQRLTPRELKWFIRLLLKNLGPAEMNENLVYVNTHPWLPSIMKIQQSFTQALEALKHPELLNHEFQWDATSVPDRLLMSALRPLVGTKIGRPEHLKMRSIKQCMQWLGNESWNAEVKYDGEYVQVHYDFSSPEQPLKLFSKSGRDSTKDRIALHGWLKSALRVSSKPAFSKNCILEGEMVLFDRLTKSILPFHSIRKHVLRAGVRIGTEADSGVKPNEQLGIVFYDLLMVDDDPIMHQPYESRRNRLRELISTFDGHIVTSQYTQLDLRPGSGKSRDQVERKLEKAFSKALALRCEGLVLKPLASPYLNLCIPKPGSTTGRILKLKSDYIDGLGDSVDMAIVGGYRGDMRGLPVRHHSLINLTHFIIACVVNKRDVERYEGRPIYKTMGVVSRDALSVDHVLELNRTSRIIAFPLEGPLSVDFDVEIGFSAAKPSFIFAKPVVAEIVSAGFDRPRGGRFMTLRFPRIKKLHYDDRSVRDVISFEEMQKFAAEAAKLPEETRHELQKWSERIRALKTRHGYVLDHSAELSESDPTLSLVQDPASEAATPASSPLEIPNGHMAQWIELYRDAATPRAVASSTASLLSTGRSRRPPLIRVDSDQLREIGSRYVSATSQHSRKRARSDSPLISPPKKRVISAFASDAQVKVLNASPTSSQDIAGNTNCGPLSNKDANAGCGKQLRETSRLALNAASRPGIASFYTAPCSPQKDSTTVAMASSPHPLKEIHISDSEKESQAKSPSERDRSVEFEQEESTEESSDAPGEEIEEGPSATEDVQRLHDVWEEVGPRLRHKSPFNVAGMAIWIPDIFKSPTLDNHIIPPLIRSGLLNFDVQEWNHSNLKPEGLNPAQGPILGSPKIVFVDKRAKAESTSILHSIMDVALAPCERVQIWDIRLLGKLISLDRDDESWRRMEEEIAPLLFGIVRSMAVEILRPVVGNTLDSDADEHDCLHVDWFRQGTNSENDSDRPLLFCRQKPVNRGDPKAKIMTNICLCGGSLNQRYAQLMAVRAHC